ncbi:tRNA (adenosine(37)-N6)-dimethylallyltransferase MiaA [Desulforhopalus singaporensis]|uniref:tRNA dimethylallyltransferase n=1 Tax=Desulforhopalus singaporensis TaxID=91360 RepID=A0A1H0QIH7_9BACT|nr:tRNA (adenosine(37)-N6)-dimethylallyltransferase MiaA [Desulforhopalus singaporensis]SDP17193.1 tRNA dimethylallyltransferase [Desulforhopalus singaporensis]
MNHDTIEKPVLILVGPTAIGKTRLSLEIAERFNCEIISVDSMQVYRYMDIGTAKATPEERARVPHHLIDIVDPEENYDAARFAEDSLALIRTIHARNKVPLLTGGTGLYLKTLLEGIFPDAPSDSGLREELRQKLASAGSEIMHEQLAAYDRIMATKIHRNDTQRLLRALEVYLLTGRPWSAHLAEHKKNTGRPSFADTLQIGLTCDRQLLYQRINKRTKIMVESGFEDEVRGLLRMGYSPELKSMQSIGYRHMNNYISNKWSFDEMCRLMARDTRRYAKRQYTWFTKMDRLQWYQVEDEIQILKKISGWLGHE